MSAKKTKKVSRAKFCTEAGRGLRRRVPEGGSRLAHCRWGTIPRANPDLGVYHYEAKGPAGERIPFQLRLQASAPHAMTMGGGTAPFTAIGTFKLRRAEDAFDNPLDVGEDGFLTVLSGYVDDHHRLHAWAHSPDPEDEPLERTMRNQAQRVLSAALHRQGARRSPAAKKSRENPAARRAAGRAYRATRPRRGTR